MDMMELRRQVLMATPHRKTLTGDLVTFDADFVAPMKLTIPMSPVQDLHGYDAPWPPGGGVNLFDVDTATVYARYLTSDNKWSTASDSGSYAFPCQPSTTYTVSASNPSITIFRVAYITATTISGSINAYSQTRLTESGSVTITTGENATYIIIQINKAMTSDKSGLVQIEYGSSMSPYHTYSNICPIDGFTAASISRIGKNFFTGATNDPKTGGATYLRPLGTNNTGKYIFLRAGTYTVTFMVDFSSSIQVGIYHSTNGGSVTMMGSNSSITNRISRTFTTEEDTYHNFYLYGSGIPSNTEYYFQIEKGSAFTSYEIYKGLAVTITFGQTVYSGYFELHEDGSGQIVADYGQYICTGTENLLKWTLWGQTDNYAGRIPLALANGKYVDGAKNAMCNMLESVSNIEMYMAQKTRGVCVSNGGYVTVQVDGITTKEDLLSWMGTNKPQIVYKLSSPLVIPLTAQQVLTLLSTNNVWCDIGQITVDYWTHEVSA